MTATALIPLTFFALFGWLVWQFTERGKQKWLRLGAFWAPLFVALWRDAIENPIRHAYRMYKFRKELEGDS